MYDGSNPPFMVKNIGISLGVYSSFFTIFNSKLYFRADDGVHGNELWEYDGVNDPHMVVDTRPGSSQR